MTFYHGTSSLILPSILETGLGGINPSSTWNTLELLKHLWIISEKTVANDKSYLIFRDTTRAMVNQASYTITNPYTKESQTVHFQHSNIYVSMSEYRSVIYAVNSKSGSEILDRCLLLMKILRKNEVEFTIPKDIDIINIEAIYNSTVYPVIIKADITDYSQVETDYGMSGVNFFEKFNDEFPKMSDKDKFEKIQFNNFKLLKPIPTTKISAYALDYEGKPENPATFSWFLNKITTANIGSCCTTLK